MFLVTLRSCLHLHIAWTITMLSICHFFFTGRFVSVSILACAHLLECIRRISRFALGLYYIASLLFIPISLHIPLANCCLSVVLCIPYYSVHTKKSCCNLSQTYYLFLSLFCTSPLALCICIPPFHITKTKTKTA